MVLHSHNSTVETDEMSCFEKMLFFPMLFFLFFMLPSSLMKLVYCHGNVDSCESVRCSRHGPEIRFPFRLKDQHQHCGYPGFDLFCNNEQTMVHFPPLGRDVVVRLIDYKVQRLLIAADDHNNCFLGLLFGTSYSYVPVSYHFPADSNIPSYNFPYSYENYTLLNCTSNDLSYNITCLSDAEHRAFVTYGARDVGSLPASCQPVKTIPVPKLYPLDLNLTRAIELETKDHFEELLGSGSSLDLFEEGILGMTWYVPGCIGCERDDGKQCRYKNSNSTDTDTVCFQWPPQPQRGMIAERSRKAGKVPFHSPLMSTIRINKICH